MSPRKRATARTCTPERHGGYWMVTVREANYSAFNGGHRTPSAYSAIWCSNCGRRWRTKAAYVKTLPDA